MGLKEVGAPLTRPRHTWETGGGKESAAVATKAEGGGAGSYVRGVSGRGCPEPPGSPSRGWH